MAIGNLGVSIIGNVNTDKKEIQFSACFMLSGRNQPVLSKGCDWSIDWMENLSTSTAYDPTANGVTIDSDTGLLKYDQQYNGSDVSTHRQATIQISCYTWVYGLKPARTRVRYTFWLYDFDDSGPA